MTSVMGPIPKAVVVESHMGACGLLIGASK